MSDYRSPSVAALEDEPMLRYFVYQHLSDAETRSISKIFLELARDLVLELPRTPERTVALRKLLESKDAAVRTAMDVVRGF